MHGVLSFYTTYTEIAIVLSSSAQLVNIEHGLCYSHIWKLVILCMASTIQLLSLQSSWKAELYS